MQSPKVLIADSHAQSYADKMPPWGFNGLGYVFSSKLPSLLGHEHIRNLL